VGTRSRPSGYTERRQAVPLTKTPAGRALDFLFTLTFGARDDERFSFSSKRLFDSLRHRPDLGTCPLFTDLSTAKQAKLGKPMFDKYGSPLPESVLLKHSDRLLCGSDEYSNAGRAWDEYPPGLGLWLRFDAGSHRRAR
jgi:hypothetical protein